MAEAAPAPIHAEGLPAVTPPAVAIRADVASAQVDGTPAPRLELHAEVAPEAATPRNAPELPRVSLDLPPESDLVLVETAHDRVAPAQTQEEQEAPRPRRVRPPRVETAEEPLQMVETSHKDSTPPAE